MVKVNGKCLETAENKNIKQFLEENGYNPLRVAVELNGEIVPKAQYESVTLKDGDEVEVVSFVGGG